LWIPLKEGIGGEREDDLIDNYKYVVEKSDAKM
jgi:hypothetical protein